MRLAAHVMFFASHMEKKTMEKISEVVFQEEIWIKQRSRINWLKAGDRNSAYFHAQVAQRRRTNYISTLQHSDGSLCDGMEEVKVEVQEFYKLLYSSQGEPVMADLLSLVQEKIDFF